MANRWQMRSPIIESTLSVSIIAEGRRGWFATAALSRSGYRLWGASDCHCCVLDFALTMFSRILIDMLVSESRNNRMQSSLILYPFLVSFLSITNSIIKFGGL